MDSSFLPFNHLRLTARCFRYLDYIVRLVDRDWTGLDWAELNSKWSTGQPLLGAAEENCENLQAAILMSRLRIEPISSHLEPQSATARPTYSVSALFMVQASSRFIIIIIIIIIIISIYLILPAALGPGVHSASNRNEHQKQKNCSGKQSAAGA
jgi:hypothetical protein